MGEGPELGFAMTVATAAWACVMRGMPRETVYILQAYVAGRGKGLKAEPQVGCKTAEEARRKAERLAPLRLGVVAFAASADPEMGDYDENPVILFKAGQLPPPWNED